MTALVRRDAVAIAQPARAVLEGPPRHAVVLGASSAWTYVDVDRFVLVLGPSSRLPNAIDVGDRPLDVIGGGRGDAVVGRMSIALAGVHVHVPPSVPAWEASVPRWSRASDLLLRAGEMARALGLRDLGAPDAAAGAIFAVAPRGWGTSAVQLSLLFDGLAGGDLRRAAAAGASMLGAGAGMTPQADDVLWAILLVLNAAAPVLSTGMTELRTWRSALCPPDLEARTTALSATLLRLAAQGLGAEPALRALDPSPGWQRGLEELWSLGHTSGRVACVATAAAISSLAGRGSVGPQADAPAEAVIDRRSRKAPINGGGGHHGV